MVSVWSDFQFAEANFWQRNVNTALLYCCILLLQQHVLILITSYTVHVPRKSKDTGKINRTKEKMIFIFHDESYETDITTDKTMIKIVRVMAFRWHIKCLFFYRYFTMVNEVDLNTQHVTSSWFSVYVYALSLTSFILWWRKTQTVTVNC